MKPPIKYLVKLPPGRNLKWELQTIWAARKRGLSPKEALRPKNPPGCRPVWFTITCDDLTR